MVGAHLSLVDTSTIPPDLAHLTVMGSAAELMHFHGAPLAHCVAYEVQLWARRRQIEMLRAYRDRPRRSVR
jgi:hypothetical protein